MANPSNGAYFYNFVPVPSFSPEDVCSICFDPLSQTADPAGDYIVGHPGTQNARHPGHYRCLKKYFRQVINTQHTQEQSVTLKCPTCQIVMGSYATTIFPPPPPQQPTQPILFERVQQVAIRALRGFFLFFGSIALTALVLKICHFTLFYFPRYATIFYFPRYVLPVHPVSKTLFCLGTSSASLALTVYALTVLQERVYSQIGGKITAWADVRSETEGETFDNLSVISMGIGLVTMITHGPALGVRVGVIAAGLLNAPNAVMSMLRKEEQV